MRIRFLLIGLLVAVSMVPTAFAATQQQVADYLITEGIVTDPTTVNLWMTATALDPSYVARDPDPAVPDVPLPYPLTWLVMIDDEPKANFGHPVRWVYVSDDLASHTVPLPNDFPPTVWASGGAGPEVPFECAPLSGAYTLPCPAPFPEPSLPSARTTVTADKACLYAIFICGQPNARYVKNLKSMYKKLRACGYKKANIFVYYLGGDALDLDGDSNSDVTGAAKKGVFRPKLQDLCATLNPQTDVLLIYTTNHGTKNGGLNLPDSAGKAVVYTPAEFSDDTKNCKACRVFVIMDQCYSGQFTGVATDGNHKNMAIYTAASADEPSQARHYMSFWEQLDPATTSIGDMHASVATSMAPPATVKTCDGGANFCELCTKDADCPGSTCSKDKNSTPQSAEGTPGIGGSSICDCCRNGVVGTLVSLVSSEAGPGWARLEWYVSQGGPATLYRRAPSTDWERVATLVADGAGIVGYEDRAVAPGARYGYQLGIPENGVERLAGETWVDVPRQLALAIDVRQNPSLGGLAAWVTLPTAARASLRVYDAAGRLVWSTDVGGLGAGQHLVIVGSARLSPGIYLIRLNQGAAAVTTRAVLLQ